MTEELDVLRIVGERLESVGVPFMLTGSFALGYYARPRMTRDLDFVVALRANDVDALVKAFAFDFYVDAEAVRAAVASQRIFNLMHLESAIKVDLIVRKDSDYRKIEFARRQAVEVAGVRTWITSREDLILSKLVWARGHEMNDTAPDIQQLITARYRNMTPDRRMRIASSMFETARAIVESSLPAGLTGAERRLALARRLYGGELPEAALYAYAQRRESGA